MRAIMRFIKIISSTATVLVALACPCAVAADYAVLVTTGLPMPDGNGSINGLGFPILNNAGQVAFRISSTSTNSSNNAIGAHDPDNDFIFQLARDVELLTGTTNYFRSVGATADHLALNGQGMAVFWSDLSDTPGGNSQATGFFRTSIGSGIVSEVVREGSGYLGRTWSGFVANDPPVVNNQLQVVVPGKFTGPGVVTTNDLGVFRIDTNATIAEIVREGGPVPGGNGYFDTFDGLNLNDAGQVSFVAGLRGTANGVYDNLGIYIGTGSSIMEIERTRYSGVYYDLGGAAPINNSGWVAYWARTTTNGIRSHILLSDGNDTLRIADTGDSVTRITNTISSINQYVEFNDQSQVLMAAIMSPGNREALIRGRSSYPLATIVAAGEVLPGRTNVITGLINFSHALNERGQVAFLAQLDNSSSEKALLLHDDAFGLMEIAKTGDSLLGSTISQLAFNGTSGSSHVPDERSGLNDSGDIAFWFELANNTQGIAKWSAPQVGITSIERRTNDVVITYGTLGNRPTLLERSTYLEGAFTTISSNYFITDGNFITTNYIDIGAITNRSQGYYRLSIEP